MVIKFPLMSSTTFPVEIKFVETVFIFVVKVWPVVIKLPLNVSTFPLKAGSELEPVVKPETIAISSVRYWPVVIKLPLKVLKSSPPARPETIAISEVRVCPVVIKSPLKASKSCPPARPETVAISLL